MENYRSYEFGIGNISEVLKGDVEKTESLEDLGVTNLGEEVIVPKIIGVYQLEERFKLDPNRKRHYDIIDNEAIFNVKGKPETINPDLICIGYDPTIIPEHLFINCLNGDSASRLKLTNFLYFPDFYEKAVPEASQKIHKMIMENDSNQKVVIERDKNLLEIARKEFGLTRYELVELLGAEGFLNMPTYSEVIMTGTPSILMPSKKDIKRLGFENKEQ